jgi:hypothetical protein
LKKFPTVVLIGFTAIWKSSKQQKSKYAHKQALLFKGTWNETLFYVLFKIIWTLA